MTKEERLILLLATQRITESEKSEIVSLAASSDISWSLFLKLASWHKLENFLYSNLRTNLLSDVLPDKVENHLKSIYYQVSIRNSSFKSVIENISSLCYQHKILIVKGSALIYDFYQDIGARRLADIDILVGKNEREAVWNALTKGGWNSDNWPGFKSKAHALVNDALYKTMHYLYYGDASNQIFVDIHWKFYIGESADKAAEYALLNCRKLRGNIYVHSDEMQLIHLCCNNYLDYNAGGAMYLRNLCDIRELLICKNINWNKVEQIFQLSDTDDFMKRAVVITLNVINRLFGTVIPVQFREEIFDGTEITPMSILRLPVTVLKKTAWESLREKVGSLDSASMRLLFLFKEIIPDRKWLRGTYTDTRFPLCAYWSYMLRRHIFHKNIKYNG